MSLSQNQILDMKQANRSASILQAAADTYIRSDLFERINDNYGRERIMVVGTSREPWGAPDAMRALLNFDVSRLSTSIESATLQLTVFSYDNGNNDSQYNVEVHRILQPWTEGSGTEADEFIPFIPGATGTDPANGVAWQNLDGNNEDQPSIDPTIVASAIINQREDVVGTVITFDITSLVQAWRDGTLPNYGIMLVDRSTDNSFRGVRFGSREGDLYPDVFPDEVQGPRLLINAPILGTPADNILRGSQGNDTIAGELGNDIISGGDGDDVLRGDRNERSPGGKTGGNDIIYGGRGGDRIGGKGGNDQLYGQEGNDQIWGDEGDDLLWGGAGNDTLTGGKGSDTFVIAIGEGTDTITDFKIGTDRIGLANGLAFGQLTKTQEGRDTWLRSNNEVLAILSGVTANLLTQSSFAVV